MPRQAATAAAAAVKTVEQQLRPLGSSDAKRKRQGRQAKNRSVKVSRSSARAETNFARLPRHIQIAITMAFAFRVRLPCTCELRQGDLRPLQVAEHGSDGDAVGGLRLEAFDSVRDDVAVQVTGLRFAAACETRTRAETHDE